MDMEGTAPSRPRGMGSIRTDRGAQPFGQVPNFSKHLPLPPIPQGHDPVHTGRHEDRSILAEMNRTEAPWELDSREG